VGDLRPRGKIISGRFGGGFKLVSAHFMLSENLPNTAKPNRAQTVNFFILCGGLATRMQGVSSTIPKSLLPVAGQPFLSHLLNRVNQEASAYVKRVVFCVGYMSEQIEAFVRSKNWPFEVVFSNDGDTPLGTGGSFRDAWHRYPSDLAAVTYGDSFIHYPIENLIKTLHSREAYEAVMTVFHNRGQFDQSNVLLDGTTVKKYSKVSFEDCDFIDYGLSLLKASAQRQFPNDGAFDLSKIFESLAVEKTLGAWPMQERFYEIGSESGYRELNQLLEVEKLP
jgi:NDP-sugar pyrophosphorylase family protein